MVVRFRNEVARLPEIASEGRLEPDPLLDLLRGDPIDLSDPIDIVGHGERISLAGLALPAPAGTLLRR